MWTSKNRARYDRSKLRYPSDLTDEEWGLVEPLIPPGKTGGGKRTVIMREVVTDPSGGSADSMTLAIAHMEHRNSEKTVILDAIRERRPPFFTGRGCR